MHPAVEQMIWAYAYGRPTEQIELSGALSVRDMSMATDQLLDEVREQQAAIGLCLSEHRAECSARAEVALLLEPNIDGEVVREH